MPAKSWDAWISWAGNLTLFVAFRQRCRFRYATSSLVYAARWGPRDPVRVPNEDDDDGQRLARDLLSSGAGGTNDVHSRIDDSSIDSNSNP